jgi:hypothetical protein
MVFLLRDAARMERRNAYRILVRKPEEKSPLGRPRHSWVNKMELTGTMGLYGLG